MHDFTQTAAIILAAGTSSRMSERRNKLLLPLGQRPVLALAIEAAAASQARPLLLVLGHQAEQVREQLHPEIARHQVQVLENPAYAHGQSTSLRLGLKTLLAAPIQDQPDSVIFLLGDQPLMTAQIIDGLIALRASSHKRIALPLYDGKRGNPVLFALDLASELLQVSGDEGGRGLLKRHPDEIATLALEETTANLDVDSWEAYQHVKEHVEKSRTIR